MWTLRLTFNKTSSPGRCEFFLPIFNKEPAVSRLSFLKKNAILGVVAAAGLTSLAESASAAELKVLGAGAIEPGLKSAAAAFEKQTGNTAQITFNTAPELPQRINGNPDFDVVITPPAVIGDVAAASKLAETRANVGRVGMGVAVRDGAPMPDISNADALRRSVLDAESLVFNRASTGLYLENLLKKMDVHAQVESKTNRYADGASVLEHVIKGKGRKIGFGAMTEICSSRAKVLSWSARCLPRCRTTRPTPQRLSPQASRPRWRSSLWLFWPAKASCYSWRRA